MWLRVRERAMAVGEGEVEGCILRGVCGLSCEKSEMGNPGVEEERCG